MATPAGSAQTASPAHFVKNVLWTWATSGLAIVIGLFLSPYVIHKLGAEGYGIWALLFSIIGYYGLVDLGIRSALIRYTAFFYARRELDGVNRLINTVLGYYTAGASVLLIASVLLSRHADRVFHISPAFRQDFARLIIVVGISTMFALNAFSGALQGLQRFDLTARIATVVMGMRAVGAFLLLYLGFGLVALGINVLATEIVGYVLAYIALRRVMPEFRLAFRLVRFDSLRQIWNYSAHTFVVNVALQLLYQSPAVLLGVLRPAAFVGYFAFPSKLIQYSADFIMRVGDVSHSVGTALAAKGAPEQLRRLAVYANRYCLALFMPLGLFLIVYGRALLNVWISPEFAANSAPAIGALVLSGAFAVAAQYNSGALLFSLAEHRRYSRALLVEAALSIGSMALAIPRFGVAGAAWGFAIPVTVIQGFVTPWLLTRTLRTAYAPFMASILGGPLLAALPAFALAAVAKRTFLPGTNWPQLICAGLLIALLYFGTAVLTSVEAEHRKLGVQWARKLMVRVAA